MATALCTSISSETIFPGRKTPPARSVAHRAACAAAARRLTEAPLRWAAVTAALVWLAGCMPAAGPLAQDVVAKARHDTAPYLLISLSHAVVDTVGQRAEPSFSGLADRNTAPNVALGVGDVVTVTIFESSAGGLFIPDSSGSRPGNFVALPDQNVDNAGNITVPYAGSIKAAGRSVAQIQQEIVDRLRDRALEPQVVVTLKDQKSSQVSVLGAVNSAGRFPINPSGDRLLDAIARAGGPAYPSYETNVTLQRRGRDATIAFADLVDDAANNVYVRGGDIVVLSRSANTFLAFGATGQEGSFDFGAEHISLADAIGKARGLLDNRASPADVFVYRLEDRAPLTALGRDLSRFPGERVPTIYRVNLRDPSGYFLASKFDVLDKDVLYIANAPIADIGKIFSIVRGGAQTVSSVGSAM